MFFVIHAAGVFFVIHADGVFGPVEIQRANLHLHHINYAWRGIEFALLFLAFSDIYWHSIIEYKEINVLKGLCHES